MQNLGKLTIELVPKTCWYSNVRSNVTKEKWDVLRKDCYRKAGYCCEICGGKGEKHPVECHEVWEYDDLKKTQKLVRLIALCPSCHEVKHIGLTEKRGRIDEAIKHLSKVNGWGNKQTKEYINEAWNVWNERSQHKWKLDISFLQTISVEVQQER